ncbi:iron uptake porin [Okeanomitos corallinicola TIOX110]|uniref:Iron uptake porin n=1 Tax=Okeanomitos corallinicola TIOX110 TaxID=3133117 RepID=A0ABZ2UY49_9CYAN
MFNNLKDYPNQLSVKQALWMTILLSSCVAIHPLQVLAETKNTASETAESEHTVIPEKISNIDINSVNQDPQNPNSVKLVISTINEPSELPVTNPSITSVEEFTDFSSNATDLTLNPGDTNDSMAQVNSVSQFRDVSPSDWAFTALQSLVERYGCIAGYPDATFRGNRAMTRYEFAAGLNACLDRIQELIATATADAVTKADLETLERLQGEFSTELANLRGRVDALEAKTAILEDQQFSTTTKLYGFAWMNLAAGFSDGNIQRELGFRGADGNPVIDTVNDPSTTFTGLVWLDFVTSFTGRDSLVLQLAMGTSNSFPGPLANSYASAGLDYSFADFTTGPGAVTPGEVTVRELYYQFPVGDKLQFVIGPRFNYFRFLEGNQFSFAFTKGAPIFNYISFNSANSTLVNAIDRGAGAIAMWDMSDKFLLKLAYMGETDEYLPSPPFNSASDPNQGLFGGTNTLTAELTYKPSRTANVRFLYTRTNMQGYDVTGSGNRQLCCGLTEPFYGVADDGLGGDVSNGTADTFGINADWRITPKFGIFGRYTYGSTKVYPTTPGVPDGEINTQSFQLGMAFPDLGKEGAMGQLSFLIPMDITSGRDYLVSGAGNGGTWYEIEGSYFVPISSNIALVPSFSVVVNPNNFDNNPTIFIGNLRTQFNF